ncbi:hypothetical protein [Paenibacillus puerhi]|uniref:hypothetical protein n=1 Tax=Paenibacillus puerhi TaxID=2692622 RepID=UPI001358BBC9|nr:hypothetical protein [Paenibacillus puerhi]
MRLTKAIATDCLLKEPTPSRIHLASPPAGRCSTRAYPETRPFRRLQHLLKTIRQGKRDYRAREPGIGASPSIPGDRLAASGSAAASSVQAQSQGVQEARREKGPLRAGKSQFDARSRLAGTAVHAASGVLGRTTQKSG